MFDRLKNKVIGKILSDDNVLHSFNQIERFTFSNFVFYHDSIIGYGMDRKPTFKRLFGFVLMFLLSIFSLVLVSLILIHSGDKTEPFYDTPLLSLPRDLRRSSPRTVNIVIVLVIQMINLVLKYKECHLY